MNHASRRHNQLAHHQNPTTSFESILDCELRQTPAAPDLTRSIMGQLGYMRCSPAVVRRRRVRRWANRGLLAAAMTVTMLFGIQMHNASSQARRPLEITIPTAVSNDFRQHQDRVQHVIRAILELPARIETPEADDNENASHLDEEVIRSAVAPVRWV